MNTGRKTYPSAMMSQAINITNWKCPVKYDSPDYVPQLRAWLETLLKDIESGNIDKHPKIKDMMESSYFMHGVLDDGKKTLPAKWLQLERTCSQLAYIAHKQLRQVPLNESDNAFIQNYGKQIADLMFYESNMYLSPRDDAPRIVDVYTVIDETGQKNLEVGVARAREMLVLHPWQGKTYLCRGAIMPYYEFSSPTRMNDTEWKTLLDSENRPNIPEWFAPIVEGNALSIPSFER